MRRILNFLKSRRTNLFISAGLAGGSLCFPHLIGIVYSDSRENKGNDGDVDHPRTTEPTVVFQSLRLSVRTQQQSVNRDGHSRFYVSERSYIPGLATGIFRYDIAEVHSDQIIAASHGEAILPVPSGFWSLFTVSDGHSNKDLSVWWQDNLIPAVVGSLADLYSKFHERLSATSSATGILVPCIQDIQRTMTDAVSMLEGDIPLDPNGISGTNLLARRVPKSLSAFYDSHSHHLHVCSTAPGPKMVLARSTVSVEGQHSCTVNQILPESTVSPQIPTTSSVMIQAGDFLIMGNTSLWDRLTEEQAVKLVGQWQDNSRKSSSAVQLPLTLISDTLHYRDDASNIKAATPECKLHPDSPVARNAAKHLILNALHFNVPDSTVPLKPADQNLHVDGPFRDGIIALIVFFDEDNSGGNASNATLNPPF